MTPAQHRAKLRNWLLFRIRGMKAVTAHKPLRQMTKPLPNESEELAWEQYACLTREANRLAREIDRFEGYVRATFKEDIRR